jgi:hypothetical protein
MLLEGNHRKAMMPEICSGMGDSVPGDIRVCLPSAGTLSRLREARLYQPTVRALGGTWFLALGILVVLGILKGLHPNGDTQAGLYAWAEMYPGDSSQHTI